MPIVEINASDLLQRCASCDAENRIAMSDLEAGSGGAEQVDARVIRLPPCAYCGSVEFLIRSEDTEAEHTALGSLGHRHRLLVDHLHAELVKGGRAHAALKQERSGAARRFGKAPAAAELEKWFPNGLKLDWPRKEGDQNG